MSSRVDDLLFAPINSAPNPFDFLVRARVLLCDWKPTTLRAEQWASKYFPEAFRSRDPDGWMDHFGTLSEMEELLTWHYDWAQALADGNFTFGKV